MSRSPAGGDANSAHEDHDLLKAPLRAFLKAKGLHESKVRDLVVDTFLDSDEHMGLESILAKVRAKNPGVGMATVYRTMKLMEEAGLVHARDFSGATVFEIAVGRPHHDHLICERCGLIVEFVSEPIERMQDKVAAQHGFVLQRHRHELFGLCEKCRRANKTSAAPASRSAAPSAPRRRSGT